MAKKQIEEIILEEIGLTLRRETEGGASDAEIIAVLKKYDRWFKSIAQRIVQQDQQIQKLTNAIKTLGGNVETVVVVDKTQAKPNKEKVLKCTDCGTISPYATGNRCPACGSKSATWTDPP